jgi:DnaJ-class molecular chaperone
MEHGSVFTVCGVGHQAPGAPTGDLLVTLVCPPHPVFRRRGQHLVVKQTLSLVEALTGFRRTLTLLDGRVLCLQSEKDMVYASGCYKVVHGEGMPGLPKGELYVEFAVDFPRQLSAAVQQSLSQLLPSPLLPPVIASALPCRMTDITTADIQALASHADAPAHANAHARTRAHTHMETEPSMSQCQTQ